MPSPTFTIGNYFHPSSSVALPVSLSGLSTACRWAGPFKSSAGNFYVIGRDGTTSTTLTAIKAGATLVFSNIATKTGFATAIEGLSASQNGDVIHMIISDGTNASHNYKYQTFDMSSDTFVTAETIVSAIAPNDSNNAIYGLCEIVYNTTLSQPTALYPGPRVSSHAKVNTKHRTGVATWSAAVVVDAAVTTVDYYPFGIVQGASGTIHFFMNPDGSTCIERAITSAFALQTAVTIGTVSGTFSGKPISLVNGANTNVCCIAINNSNGNPDALRFNSASVPTISVSSDIGTGADTHLGPRTYATGTNFWALYTRSSTGDVYTSKSTDAGATWSAETLAMAATATASGPNNDEFLGLGATCYVRGGNTVVPYVVNDGGTLKYNELITF